MSLPDVVDASLCKLPDDQMEERLARFRELLRRTLVSHSRADDGFVWVLRHSPATEAEVRQLAADELRCCSFFTFDIKNQGDHIHWRVSAPPSAIAMLDKLYQVSPEPIERATTSLCCAQCPS